VLAGDENVKPYLSPLFTLKGIPLRFPMSRRKKERAETFEGGWQKQKSFHDRDHFEIEPRWRSKKETRAAK